MSPSVDPGLQWLLASKDPSVRSLALVGVAGASPRSGRVRRAREEIPRGPRVRALLRGQRRDGSFGGLHPYSKWEGSHWRLVSLVELGIARGHPKGRAAVADVLRWLARSEHTRSFRRVAGRVRRHASMEGNALAVCARLGLAKDPRVAQLVERLLVAQWDDGGWNCDPDPGARTSSFYETLTPMWGLAEYARETGDAEARAAAERAAEVFLERRLFRARRDGSVINAEWLKLHYPLYWHYDVLGGLVMLGRLGKLSDPRAREALDLIESKRRPDGTWRVEGSYWRPPGPRRSNADVVDWGRAGPNEMITLNALRVLRAAGRL